MRQQFRDFGTVVQHEHYSEKKKTNVLISVIVNKLVMSSNASHRLGKYSTLRRTSHSHEK